MGFLNGIVLWGLAAAALPVLVHLLNKFQVQRVRWAAMRFLNEAMQRTQRKLRLEDVLLLLLRCLAVALLVLAFARPVLHWKGGDPVFSGSPVDAVLVVDDSMSMGMSNGVSTSFEQARDAAGKVLDGLGSGSEAALFFVSDRVKKAVPIPTRDFALLRRNLQEGGPGSRASNLLPGIQAAVDLLKGRTGKPKDLFLFTDDQEGAWRQSAEIQALFDQSKADIRFHLLPAGDGMTDNLAIASVKLDVGLPVANQPLRCLVQVSNWGASAANDVRVSVSTDQSPPQAEAVIPQIDPGQSVTASLILRVGESGPHTLTASIPPDRLPADNQRSTAFLAQEQVRVLVVEADPSAARQDQDGFFLVNALTPVSPDQRDSYYLKVADGSEADLGRGNLSQYDAIFLAGMGRLEAKDAEALAAYVKQGGGLVLVPGKESDIQAYNNDPALGPLLPAKLSPAQDAPAKFLFLQHGPYLHPLVAFWNDAENGGLDGMRLSRFHPLMLSAAAPGSAGAQAVIAYADGQPAIADRAVGAGRILQFGFPLLTAWGNVPIHPSFVPLVQRLVGYLSKHDSDELSLAPGSTFTQQAGIETVGKEFSVLAPGDKEKRVGGHVDLDGQNGVIHFSETDNAGPYLLFLGDNPKPIAAFAVQTDPAESNLARVPDETIAFLQGGGKNGSGSGGAGNGSAAPEEIWLPCLLGAFAAFLLELILATWFSRSR